jgi:hypothetical protein
MKRGHIYARTLAHALAHTLPHAVHQVEPQPALVSAYTATPGVSADTLVAATGGALPHADADGGG